VISGIGGSSVRSRRKKEGVVGGLRKDVGQKKVCLMCKETYFLHESEPIAGDTNTPREKRILNHPEGAAM